MVREAISRGFGRNRQLAFACCGSWCVIERSPSEGRVRIRGNYCHDRFCEPCGKGRANLIARNLQAKMEEPSTKPRYFRLITLTLKHSAKPLADQVDRLLKSFRALRQRPCWKLTQTGGASFVEVKRTDAGEWHPHLHVIAEGGYLASNTLSAEWHRITKDSMVTDVRMVRDASQASAYVAKYASNPLDPSVFESVDLLEEAMRSLTGRRLCTTIGSWRGFQLEKKRADPKDWVLCWKLAEFLVLLAAGDVAAVRFARDNRICEQALDEQQDLYMSSA